MSIVNTQMTSIMIFNSLIRDQKVAGNVFTVYNSHTRLLDRSDIFLSPRNYHHVKISREPYNV